jgi:hypothetical protein
MQWIGIILKIIPMIAKLMKIAEQAFDGVKDSGAQKKQMVMDAIKAITEAALGSAFTQELWAKIEKVLSPIIDIAASFLFPHDEK